MSQTTHPLITGIANPSVPTWAVLCDCAGIFDKHPPKNFEHRPIILPIITLAMFDTVAPDGLGVRILVPMASMSLMKPSEELKDKGKLYLADREGVRIMAPSDCANFVGIVHEPDPNLYLERCKKKRLEVEQKIKEMMVMPLLVPDRTIYGPDGAPVH